MQTNKVLAQIIWDYMVMDMPLERADVIMVLGSIDPRVAEYGAKLWQEKWAPIMLFSGTGFGHSSDLLATNYEGKAESEYFAEIAEEKGVPKEVIYIEKESKNTGENAQFGYQKLIASAIPLGRIIVVTKPYMVRRAFATFKKQWPKEETEILVTGPRIDFDSYFTKEQPFDQVVNIMIGDLERIKKYPKKGYQIPQEIPDEVWAAFEELVNRGYTKHLIKD